MHRPLLSPLLAVLVLAGASCEPKVEGFPWHVQVLAVETNGQCGAGESMVEQYCEDFTYLVDFAGSSADIYLQEGNAETLFANGSLVGGCELEYETVVWQEDRDAGQVRYQLTGEARFRQWCASCEMQDFDWIGTETYTILSSTDPDAPTGCAFTLQVRGCYAEDGATCAPAQLQCEVDP